MNPKISIIAPAIRTHLWNDFANSLLKNKVSYEIIFVGPKAPECDLPNLRHIKTGNIKPAQCIHIAYKEAKGEVIHWSADDCIYPDGILDDVYHLYNSFGDYQIVIACETIECGKLCPVESFRLYDDVPDSPIMAPLGFMSKRFIDELGGICDRRYTGGQWENDLLMRMRSAGGRLYTYTDKKIELDHYNKHVNHCSDFSDAYKHGRQVLEASWPRGAKERTDNFLPFEDSTHILTRSQSPKGIWD